MSKIYNHLVWLGAGNATDPKNLLDQTETATLIEARVAACSSLASKVNNQNVEILPIVVTGDGRDVLFTTKNIGDFSAASRAISLKNLFPGLTAIDHEHRTSRKISEVIANLNIQSKNNILIADIIDLNSELLKAIKNQDQLEIFNEILIHTAPKDAFEGSPEAKEIILFLEESGYQLEKSPCEDPDIPWLRARKNPLWTKFQEILSEREKESKESENIINISKKLKETIKEKEKIIDHLQRENELLNDKIDGLIKKSCRKSKTQVGENTSNSPKIKIEESSFDKNNFSNELMLFKEQVIYFLGQQSLQLEQATNALGRHMSKIAKEIPRRLKEQEEATKTEKIISEVNLDSPTWIDKLTNQIRNKSYNLIIEMGGSEITIALGNIIRENFLTANPDFTYSENASALNQNNSDNRESFKRVVCFENNKIIYEELADIIKEKNLLPSINLELTPLINFSLYGKEVLFYDCENHFQKISDAFNGQQATILILMNTPLGYSKPDVNIALQIILKHLSFHTLDICLNTRDSDHVPDWHRLLNGQGLLYHLSDHGNNNALPILTINP